MYTYMAVMIGGGGGGNTISWKNELFQMLVMNADSCLAFILAHQCDELMVDAG